MKSKLILALVVALSLGIALPASADNLNILWYTGGTEVTGSGSYEAAINALAADAPTAPGGNTWNVTFWSGGALPGGTYNALVVASPQGGWGTFPDYTALANSGLSFDPTANRIMLTGQDADWHLTHTPGATNFDGPSGFLLDAINWAASGSGMGLVDLGFDSADLGGGGFSSVADPVLTTGGGYTETFNATDNVVIPAAEASFPINTNLDSAGLSNWGESAHNSFQITNTSLWNGINLNGSVTGCDAATGSGCQYVTIVSAATASGGISGGGSTVPEPTSLITMVGAGLLGLAGLRRRKANA